MTSATIDVRQIAPRERHALVFSRFDALRPGQALQLVNDHDPQGLRRQLESRSAGQFEWRSVEAEPGVWRVLISRTAAEPARDVGDSCCSGGSCAG